MRDLIDRQAAIETVKKHYRVDNDLLEVIAYEIEALPPAQPGQRNARVFQGIIVEYPSISAYPEYEGKPYFSIKYTVNGQKFIGYGTYKPEVLSEYLKEYFMPSAQPGWIPVTEKPIEGGQYIVTLKDDKEVWADIAEWNPTFGGRWQAEFFDCEYRDIDNVVAWMPLTSPYREGGQDERSD